MHAFERNAMWLTRQPNINLEKDRKNKLLFIVGLAGSKSVNKETLRVL